MEKFLKVSLTKNFGNGNSITIEMQGTKAIPADQTGLPEFDAMVVRINDMVEHYAVEHLPRLTFNATAGQTTLLDALRVDVTIDRGKRYVKVSTPQYNDFGIQWWPEDRKAAGLKEDWPPPEGYVCKKGSKVEVLMVDGKPKKVIKIIAPPTEQ
jgi:hypothetical protein